LRRCGFPNFFLGCFSLLIHIIMHMHGTEYSDQKPDFRGLLPRGFFCFARIIYFPEYLFPIVKNECERNGRKHEWHC